VQPSCQLKAPCFQHASCPELLNTANSSLVSGINSLQTSYNSVINSDISQMRIRLKDRSVSRRIFSGTILRRTMPKKVVSMADGVLTTGAFVPTNGIYAVRHREHRLPGEVTLVAGEIFPRCEACESPVSFRLIRKLSGSGPLSRFHVQLFQLPVLDKQKRAS
jgi:hypothetical protein